MLSAAQVFLFANEPNGDATNAIDDVYGLAVEFLYELLCSQIQREFRPAQAHGITELVFSPARLLVLHLIELVCARVLW